jgi:cytochrome c556
MKKKVLYSCLALALGTGAGYATSIFAQAKPETLVKQRQAAMALQSKYFYGQLRLMARGKMPYDATRAARAAGFLEALSQMPWDGFVPSTANVKSAALPAVFSEPAKFKEAQDRLQGESSKLVALIKGGGDEAAVKAQILAVDKTCGGCHDNFRE